MDEKLNTEPMEALADTGAEQKPCFDEILTDKEYQSEFDRRVAKAIETAKAKWTDEGSTAKTDALEAELDGYRKREAALKMGVAHDMLDYAVYSAQKLTDDSCSFEDALTKIITQQSWLTASSLPTTGIPQSGAMQGKSGVERAFLGLNPRIKI